MNLAPANPCLSFPPPWPPDPPVVLRGKLRVRLGQLPALRWDLRRRAGAEEEGEEGMVACARERGALPAVDCPPVTPPAPSTGGGRHHRHHQLPVRGAAATGRPCGARCTALLLPRPSPHLPQPRCLRLPRRAAPHRRQRGPLRRQLRPPGPARRHAVPARDGRGLLGQPQRAAREEEGGGVRGAHTPAPSLLPPAAHHDLRPVGRQRLRLGPPRRAQVMGPLPARHHGVDGCGGEQGQKERGVRLAHFSDPLPVELRRRLGLVRAAAQLVHGALAAARRARLLQRRQRRAAARVPARAQLVAGTAGAGSDAPPLSPLV